MSLKADRAEWWLFRREGNWKVIHCQSTENAKLVMVVEWAGRQGRRWQSGELDGEYLGSDYS